MFREIEKVFFTIDTKKAYEYSRLVQLMWLLFKGTIAFEVSFIANDYENFVNRFTYNFGPIWNSLSTHQDWSVAKKNKPKLYSQVIDCPMLLVSATEMLEQLWLIKHLRW